MYPVKHSLTDMMVDLTDMIVGLMDMMADLGYSGMESQMMIHTP